MKFELKPTKGKEASVYKTIYLKEKLAVQIEAIAKANNTSFNNVVVSMIESCLEEEPPTDL